MIQPPEFRTVIAWLQMPGSTPSTEASLRNLASVLALEFPTQVRTGAGYLSLSNLHGRSIEIEPARITFSANSLVNAEDDFSYLGDLIVRVARLLEIDRNVVGGASADGISSGNQPASELLVDGIAKRLFPPKVTPYGVGYRCVYLDDGFAVDARFETLMEDVSKYYLFLGMNTYQRPLSSVDEFHKILQNVFEQMTIHMPRLVAELSQDRAFHE